MFRLGDLLALVLYFVAMALMGIDSPTAQPGKERLPRK